MLLLYNNVA